MVTFRINRLFKDIREDGLKKVILKSISGWYKSNKLLLWLVLIIILLGVLPIFPSSSSKEIILNVPYTSGEHSFLEYGIKIINVCDSFYLFGNENDLKIDLTKDYYIYKNNPGTNNNPDEIKTISSDFGDYKISIFAIKACDSCIDDNSVSLLEEKTCLMNQSSIFGYFEKCIIKSTNYNYDEYNCIRYPFVTSNNISIIPPNKKFKVEIEPYVIKTRVKGELTNNPVINKYYTKLIITYPKWKGLPYMKWVGTALLFLLEPLKAILRYFTDNWSY